MMAVEADRGAPWRVGVLFSRTGFMSIIEETQLQGTLLAIDEINGSGGVCGRELKSVIYDPASDSSCLWTIRQAADDRGRGQHNLRLLHLV